MLRMAERKKNNAEMSRKKKRDRTPKRTETLIEQNESFAYIAGYTDGDVPYGITWEEQAEIDRKEEELRQSRLNQGAPEEGNGQERRKDSEGFEEPEWDELPF